jgi:PKHD-type hydroxylase
MFNTSNFSFFFDALDKKTCDKIKNSAKNKWGKGVVQKNPHQESFTDKKLRISDVVWVGDDWIYKKIIPYMKKANELCGWKYDITSAEDMQITRYKKGGFYGFHKDGKSDHLSAYDMPGNESLHGNVRKLSMTVLLNDDYEGGEFQFATYSEEKCTIHTPEFNKIGSIVVFPSDMEHRVTPVTKGIRYSLVVWFLGPPFK